MQISKDEYNIHVLHMHWLIADSINERMKEGRKSKEGLKPLIEDIKALALNHSYFLSLSVWYSLLYVVIEGYKQLNLNDNKIDQLLAEGKYVDLLRRFRNSVFHFQEEPLSSKTLDFLEAEASEVWIRKLNSAFKTFFEEFLPIKEIMEVMKL